MKLKVICLFLLQLFYLARRKHIYICLIWIWITSRMKPFNYCIVCRRSTWQTKRLSRTKWKENQSKIIAHGSLLCWLNGEREESRTTMIHDHKTAEHLFQLKTVRLWLSEFTPNLNKLQKNEVIARLVNSRIR